MIAINRKEHHKILAAFDELETYLSPEERLHHDELRELKSMFRRYHQLLDQLAGCIESYEQLHHHLRVNILAPQLRQVRKQAREREREQHGKILLL